MGLADLANFKNPELLRLLDTILNAAARRNLVPGVHANTPENAIMLSERGFRFVTPANDTLLLRDAAKNAVAQTRKGLGQV
jgi:2-keto-3-deoxy-L-rhamnonate aldolase RhmA